MWSPELNQRIEPMRGSAFGRICRARPHASSSALGCRSRMRVPSRSVAIARSLVVLAPACLGWLLYHGAAWLVSHDSVEYQLHDAGFSGLTNLAEAAFAAGVFPCALAGLVFGLPAALAVVFHLRWAGRVAVANAAAFLALVCGLGLVSPWPTSVVLSVTVLLWVLAAIMVLVCLCQSAQLGAPANSGPARCRGDSEVSGGPRSVS